MYQLLVELQDFSAAHRLIKGYTGKCNHLHGHNYSLRIIVAARCLDDNDLVVDFSVVRKICNAWVQHHIDHCTLVYEQDEALLSFLKNHAQKHYLLSGNTTVECLAKEIYRQLSAVIANIHQKDAASFYLSQVELWESQQCGVVYTATQIERRGVLCG
ncbi:MAG: hypothetical protein A3F17_08205 [Gammaproteobacteria bacterium RIFCSPHIGHO2_12_FULL_41_15]|nr:MAG: hypothetical protein A3F17_08205 [Gammaproteobacteria bacterium RIFCSPHIGHO2_12_FULL_41_15]